MNSNKISCQKYVFEQIEYNSSPILELSVKLSSQIFNENTNTPLDGAYLTDFGIDVKHMQTLNLTKQVFSLMWVTVKGSS